MWKSDSSSQHWRDIMGTMNLGKRYFGDKGEAFPVFCGGTMETCWQRKGSSVLKVAVSPTVHPLSRLTPHPPNLNYLKEQWMRAADMSSSLWSSQQKYGHSFTELQTPWSPFAEFPGIDGHPGKNLWLLSLDKAPWWPKGVNLKPSERKQEGNSSCFSLVLTSPSVKGGASFNHPASAPCSYLFLHCSYLPKPDLGDKEKERISTLMTLMFSWDHE